MRYLTLDVLLVGAHEPSERNVAIVNREFESLADQGFNQRHHRRFTEIVSSGFEAESEYAHAFLATSHHHLHRTLNLQSIARQNRGEHRHFDVELLCFVVNGAQIFRQTGAAKREPWLQ